jgi:N-acetylmuramoyl-L-alanine amidase
MQAIVRCPFAIWAPSPNFDARPSDAPPSFLVNHITDGQPDVKAAVERFQSRDSKVSPHFCVGRVGELYQLVDLDKRAWHCAGWNGESIGVEHVARTPRELRVWPHLAEHSRECS